MIDTLFGESIENEVAALHEMNRMKIEESLICAMLYGTNQYDNISVKDFRILLGNKATEVELLSIMIPLEEAITQVLSGKKD